MTEIYRTISTEREDDVSPTKCRERRRRRIEMRRQAAIFGDPSSSSTSRNQEVYSRLDVTLRKHARRSEIGGLPANIGGFFAPRQNSITSLWKREEMEYEPTYGIVSVMGRSRKMEDAVTFRPNLCRPEINRQKPVHFFAIYDGHGGSQVSTLCSTTMHTIVKEELEKSESCKHEEEEGNENDVVEKKWRGVMKQSFKRMDELATSTCVCETTVPLCSCDPIESAICGSTAVTAVLTQEHIVVANAGDSRAVLCRSGMAIPLSNDHKPDRPDERARIEAAGGRVLVVDGARVEGILATSRAIGDRYLKPMVASEPEVTIMSRNSTDECLILASDGLWDVLSSQLACDITRFCLLEEAPSSLDLNRTAQEDDNGGERNGGLEENPSRSVLAATLLTRLALGRQSNDNISVIVIDLKNSS